MGAVTLPIWCGHVGGMGPVVDLPRRREKGLLGSGSVADGRAPAVIHTLAVHTSAGPTRGGVQCARRRCDNRAAVRGRCCATGLLGMNLTPHFGTSTVLRPIVRVRASIVRWRNSCLLQSVPRRVSCEGHVCHCASAESAAGFVASSWLLLLLLLLRLLRCCCANESAVDSLATVALRASTSRWHAARSPGSCASTPDGTSTPERAPTSGACTPPPRYIGHADLAEDPRAATPIDATASARTSPAALSTPATSTPPVPTAWPALAGCRKESH
eukprot:365023-Chlamydomonas_euryale.AAC.37